MIFVVSAITAAVITPRIVGCRVAATARGVRCGPAAGEYITRWVVALGYRTCGTASRQPPPQSGAASSVAAFVIRGCCCAAWELPAASGRKQVNEQAQDMPRPVPTDPIWIPRGEQIGKVTGVRSAHRQHPAQKGCVTRRAAAQLSAHHGKAPADLQFWASWDASVEMRRCGCFLAGNCADFHQLTLELTSRAWSPATLQGLAAASLFVDRRPLQRRQY